MPPWESGPGSGGSAFSLFITLTEPLWEDPAHLFCLLDGALGRLGNASIQPFQKTPPTLSHLEDKVRHKHEAFPPPLWTSEWGKAQRGRDRGRERGTEGQRVDR